MTEKVIFIHDWQDSNQIWEQRKFYDSQVNRVRIKFNQIIVELAKLQNILKRSYNSLMKYFKENSYLGMYNTVISNI